jgi:leucyl-tRNA synthetase
MAPDEWLYPTIDGVAYKRETNTMPQWAGSCWYYLRFLDPTNDRAAVDPEIERAWMPVDLYIGGAEHAVLHLLYARFWHKVLYDRGVVSTVEPFQRLVNQGMILGELEITGYQDAAGKWVSAKNVRQNEQKQPIAKTTGDPVSAVRIDPADAEKRGDALILKADESIALDSRAHKMSKSRGNVINPDSVVAEYGADALRLYEMFMGPLEATKPWSMDGVSGVRNFLDRLWRMIVDEKADELALHVAVQDAEPTEEQLRTLHKTIQAVTDDLGRLSFNTAIARMMEFVNFFTKETVRPRSVIEPFVLLVSPLAPHVAEELWQLLGHTDSLAHARWPQFDHQWVIDETVEIPVQINGKLRSKISVAADSTQETLVAAAQSDAKVAELLEGKTIVKTVAIPGRMVNFVVRP